MERTDKDYRETTKLKSLAKLFKPFSRGVANLADHNYVYSKLVITENKENHKLL